MLATPVVSLAADLMPHTEPRQTGAALVLRDFVGDAEPWSNSTSLSSTAAITRSPQICPYMTETPAVCTELALHL